MNRLHKYRAWDKKNKQWVYFIDMEPEYNKGVVSLTFNGCDEDNIILTDITSNIDESTITQFTGLKDKNGKETYFKDIITEDDGYSWYMGVVDMLLITPGCIHDCGEVFGVGYKPIDGVYNYRSRFRRGWSKIDAYEKVNKLLANREFEVIGNIYENPERVI